MRKTDKSDEIIENISLLIDNDIDRLVSGKKLEGVEIPEFDQYGVYERILYGIESHKKSKLRKIYYTAVSVAAVALILIGTYFMRGSLATEERQVYSEIYAHKGEKLVVLMTDGSRVWLNADSKLEYPEDFSTGARTVKLTGEAYFEVAKDKERPFTVVADDVNIRVLGTSFNVSAYPSDGEIITTLCEGSISIGDLQNKNYTMIPGETAIYDKNTSEYNIIKDEYYLESPQWKDNYMAFRNSSLRNVLENISRKFDVEFEINDKIVNTYTYNITCNVNDLRSILDMISSITPVDFVKVKEGKYSVVSKQKNKK